MPDIAVLWIYQEVIGPRGEQLEAGQKPALCFRGTKHMLCVVAGHPVRVLKRSAKEFDKARRVLQNGEEYPAEKAQTTLLDVAARNGATEQAQRLLNSSLQAPIDETAYQDEEKLVSTDPDWREIPEREDKPSKRVEGVPRSDVLGRVCAELSIDPAVARRRLRKADLSAPYNDENVIRGALK